MGVWDDDRKMTDESKDAEIYIYTCVQHILPPKKSIRYMQSKSDELEWEKRKESFFFFILNPTLMAQTTFAAATFGNKVSWKHKIERERKKLETTFSSSSSSFTAWLFASCWGNVFFSDMQKRNLLTRENLVIKRSEPRKADAKFSAQKEKATLARCCTNIDETAARLTWTVFLPASQLFNLLVFLFISLPTNKQKCKVNLMRK